MGENIGASARAMHNFGLSDLRLVSPRDGWPNRMAVEVARNAAEIVHNARIYESLKDAAADINIIYATTARPRDIVKPVVNPHICASEIRSLANSGTKCAIMFGPERSGMSNDDLVLADKIVTIPVSPDNPSLNLAQAVLVVCYEWFSLGAIVDTAQEAGEELATKEELAMLLEHLEGELENKGFFRQPKMRYKMSQNLANIFTRSQLTAQEVRTLRGVVRSLADKRGKPSV